MILIFSCICISLMSVSIVVYIYNQHNQIKTDNKQNSDNQIKTDNKQNSDIQIYLLADSIEEEYHYNQDIV